MKHRTFLFGIALLTASATAANGQHPSHGSSPSALVEQVREATGAFRHAVPDDYQEFLGCVSGPEQGAMGVHFVNFALVDGKVDAKAPEALIYEVKDGATRLLGVEYIVPVDAWHPSEGEPPVPVLEGQVFHFNESPNRFGLPAFYELHVWAWRENPNGTFADWNPRVSCDAQ